MTTFDTIYNSISMFVLKYLNFDNLFFILIGVVAFSVLVGVIFGKKGNHNQKVNRKAENQKFLDEFQEKMHDRVTSPRYSYLPGNINYSDHNNNDSLFNK